MDCGLWIGGLQVADGDRNSVEAMLSKRESRNAAKYIDKGQKCNQAKERINTRHNAAAMLMEIKVEVCQVQVRRVCNRIIERSSLNTLCDADQILVYKRC